MVAVSCSWWPELHATCEPKLACKRAMTRADGKDGVPVWAHCWTTPWLRWTSASCPGVGLRSAAAPPPVFSVTQNTQSLSSLKNQRAEATGVGTLGVPSHLVYHEGLDLALQDLHAGRGDDGAHVRDHALAQDLTDQTVVSLETRGGRMLHRKTIVVVWGQETHLRRWWINTHTHPARVLIHHRLRWCTTHMH